jgi:hypothetical protein
MSSRGLPRTVGNGGRPAQARAWNRGPARTGFDGDGLDGAALGYAVVGVCGVETS